MVSVPIDLRLKEIDAQSMSTRTRTALIAGGATGMVATALSAPLWVSGLGIRLYLVGLVCCCVAACGLDFAESGLNSVESRKIPWNHFTFSNSADFYSGLLGQQIQFSSQQTTAHVKANLEWTPLRTVVPTTIGYLESLLEGSRRIDQRGTVFRLHPQSNILTSRAVVPRSRQSMHMLLTSQVKG